MAIKINAQNRSSEQYRAERAQQAAEEAAEVLGKVSGNATVGGSLSVTGAFGVNGATAVGKSAAYTKTYSTPARTIPNATAANSTTVAVEISAGKWGYTTEAGAKGLVEELNKTQADVLALKKLIVALVEDLEAVGIAG